MGAAHSIREQLENDMTADGQGPGAVVQALFNMQAYSDMILNVNGRKFYVHREYIVPQSAYLQRFVQWPQKSHQSSGDDGDGGVHIDSRDDGEDACGDDSRGDEGNRSRSVVNIDLPVLESVLESPPGRRTDPTHCFELYLKVVYRIHLMKEENLEEILAAFQVADFMVSTPLVMKLFDKLLSSISLTDEHTTRMAVFCQKYDNLPACLEMLKKRLAKTDGLSLVCDKHIYQVNEVLFSDIVKLSSYDRWWFWIVASYAANTLPYKDKDGIVHIPCCHIKEEKMFKLFRNLVTEMRGRWKLESLKHICDDMQRISVIFHSTELDQFFLARTFAKSILDMSTQNTARR